MATFSYKCPTCKIEFTNTPEFVREEGHCGHTNRDAHRRVSSTFQSGERDAHSHITTRGSAELRAVLCEAAHHARCHPLQPGNAASALPHHCMPTWVGLAKSPLKAKQNLRPIHLMDTCIYCNMIVYNAIDLSIILDTRS
jgi:Transposase IS116/IS110/IS902 family